MPRGKWFLFVQDGALQMLCLRKRNLIVHQGNMKFVLLPSFSMRMFSKITSTLHKIPYLLIISWTAGFNLLYEITSCLLWSNDTTVSTALNMSFKKRYLYGNTNSSEGFSTKCWNRSCAGAFNGVFDGVFTGVFLGLIKKKTTLHIDYIYSYIVS